MSYKAKPGLALSILEAASKEGDSSQDDGKLARSEAGKAFLRAIESGDGEAVAQAMSDLAQITMD